MAGVRGAVRVRVVEARLPPLWSHVLFERTFHPCRVVPTLPQQHYPIRVDEVGDVRGRPICAPHRVVRAVDKHGDSDTEFPHHLACLVDTFNVRRRLSDGIARAVGTAGRGPFLIAVRGDGAGGVRLDRVDGDECEAVAVRAAQVFRGSDPLLEWGSGEGAEDHDHGLLRQKA